MAKIICLANSRKHGGSCVAGIDLQTEQWVRPVYAVSSMGLSFETRAINGREPALLEVLEIPFEPSAPNPHGFQPENRLLGDGPWRRVGRVEARALLRVCEKPDVLLGNAGDRIGYSAINKLAVHRRRSLCLVHARNFTVEHVDREDRRPQWRAHFDYGGRILTKGLVITDGDAEARLEAGETPARECILTISLGEPWEGYCYKLVAGIVEL